MTFTVDQKYTEQEIATNIAILQENIEKARLKSELAADKVNLIAVSKMHPPVHIEKALKAGHRIFGENKVQEAAKKWPALREKYKNIELHMIGPLQTNKVGQMLQHFDVLHSLDRPKLARVLAKEMDKQGKRIDCFIQLNTGNEDQKSGHDPEKAGKFIQYCQDELDLPVVGLMCIPPIDQDPEVHFGFLLKLAQDYGLKCLSMGMSSDYRQAVRFGSTHVRIGTSIFGPRVGKKEHHLLEHLP